MRTYGIEAVTAASGASAQNIRDWQRCGVLTSPLAAAGNGRPRPYTLANIYEFAILREMSSYGIHLKQAITAIGDAIHGDRPVWLSISGGKLTCTVCGKGEMPEATPTSAIWLDIPAIKARVDAALGSHDPNA